jgi:hypothetical protein
VVLDPTDESHPPKRPRVRRPRSLAGVTVGLLDISKPRGDRFLDRLAARLGERGIATERFRKPTFTRPAPVDLRFEIASRCGAVVEALAD